MCSLGFKGEREIIPLNCLSLWLKMFSRKCVEVLAVELLLIFFFPRYALLQLVNSNSLTTLQNKTAVYQGGQKWNLVVCPVRLWTDKKIHSNDLKNLNVEGAFRKLHLIMFVPNIFPNSLGDRMHTQETMIYSRVFSLCARIQLMDYRIVWFQRSGLTRP